MEPIGPLTWEHRRIEKILPILESEIKKIDELQTVDPNKINQIGDFFRIYADKTHHGKEEDILFKELEDKPLNDEEREIMEQLKKEHDLSRRTVDKLLNANLDYERGNDNAILEIKKALKQLGEIYPEHISKEDTEFFHPSMNHFTVPEKQKMLKDFNEFDMNMIHKKYRMVLENLSSKPLDLFQETEHYIHKASYRCSVCGYIYSPDLGDPKHGIEKGTPWKDLPDDWVCPICLAPKDRFEKIE
jgi:hemerythrin-like domain-containing protein/rubredoxin